MYIYIYSMHIYMSHHLFLLVSDKLFMNNSQLNLYVLCIGMLSRPVSLYMTRYTLTDSVELQLRMLAYMIS